MNGLTDEQKKAIEHGIDQSGAFISACFTNSEPPEYALKTATRLSQAHTIKATFDESSYVSAIEFSPRRANHDFLASLFELVSLEDALKIEVSPRVDSKIEQHPEHGTYSIDSFGWTGPKGYDTKGINLNTLLNSSSLVCHGAPLVLTVTLKFSQNSDGDWVQGKSIITSIAILDKNQKKLDFNEGDEAVTSGELPEDV